MNTKIITLNTLRACLYQRVPPSEFMRHECSGIVGEDIQSIIVEDLRQISISNAYYVKLFLSIYIALLETHSGPIEDVYELYCDSSILNAKELSPTTEEILQYQVDDVGTSVAISEFPKIISGAGTTGLRTWEAAIFLSYYLNTTPSINEYIRGKHILELGTGTGLVSLSMLKKYDLHQFCSITLTDGDSALLEKLPGLFQLNNISPIDTVKVAQLVWGTTNPTNEAFVQQAPKADIVVAADVTYDSSIVPSLSETLTDLFHSGCRVAFIAATVRNPATIECWEQELSVRFKWSMCKKSTDPHKSESWSWFKQGTSEIRIYKIYSLSRQ